MSTDERLEREVERWLAETARPMPPELLEEVLADVPRAPQAGSTGRFGSRPRWLVPGAIAALTLVVAVAVVANLRPSLGPGGVPTHGNSPAPSGIPLAWDPFEDFVTGPAY